MKTNSEHYNVQERYKFNSYEQNVDICNNDRLDFSVGVINVTGDLNVGIMIRSASLLGAKNFYIFGRKKFDKRSTVGAEKYINIVQYVSNNPLDMDNEIADTLSVLPHDIFVCEHGGTQIGSPTAYRWYGQSNNPLFLFGSESHGIPRLILENIHYTKLVIPQRGVLRSFNVSSAMNIVCWDYVRWCMEV